METYFTCLCCEAEYFKEDHDCKSGKFCNKRSDKHRDFCPRCHHLLVQNFEDQLRRKELPPAHIRFEDDDGRQM